MQTFGAGEQRSRSQPLTQIEEHIPQSIGFRTYLGMTATRHVGPRHRPVHHTIGEQESPVFERLSGNDGVVPFPRLGLGRRQGGGESGQLREAIIVEGDVMGDDLGLLPRFMNRW